MVKISLILVKLAVTVVCLFFVFRDLNWADFVTQISSLSVYTLVIGLMVFLSHLSAVAVRWREFVVTLGFEIGLEKSIRLNALGTLLNQVFFGTIAGDASRIAYLVGRGARPLVSVGSVLLDRYTALFTMWVTTLILAPFFLVEFHDSDFAFNAVLAIIVGGSALVIFPFLGMLRGDLSFIRIEFIRRTAIFFSSLSQGFCFCHKSPTKLVKVYLPSIYIILTSSFLTWTIAGDVGANLTFGSAFLATPIALLVSAVPVSIGGWGLRELSFVTLLGLFSVDTEQSLAVSVSFGFLMLLSAVIGGIYWTVSDLLRQE